MATAPSANDLTRQQLDELDDLLQRMLNLPLTGTEPPAAQSTPAGPTWRYDAPSAPPIPSPHLVAPPEPPRAPVLVAPPAPAPPVVVRPEPVTAPVPLIPPPEPTTPIIERKPTPPSARRAPKPAPVVSAPPPEPAPQVVYEPQPPLPVLLWPLAGLNWVFDRAAGLLGPPGWLLRSGFGKNVLGLAGIGLLLYTAAHLATDAGWVTLPFPVPWPR
ncbi:hypothetical protein [Urbifossiella limnaea]|uniref:Major cell-surface adhesin PAc n=1 Tax=Urbifossiella limnaea TaxID=2528023 RepID=A0A517XNL5_9BACT|nr:hypothetical protein [Urbifossiella limnaea]QDU19098.1 Major cell-surface adhesin PAc precursor [Urbifossiella limnaea]